MISTSWSIEEFVEAVKDRDRMEIIGLGAQEASEAERRSYRAKGAPRARAEGSAEYVRALGRFVFLIKDGTKPHSISDRELRLYRPVCQNLVNKGEFGPEIMRIFEDE